MIQVQVRLPNNSVKTIDEWIKKGYFESRSDTLRTILNNYEEKEKTMEFYKMLIERSNESKDKDNLVSLDYIDAFEEMALLKKGVKSLKDSVKKTKLKYISQKDFEKKYKYLEK